MVVQCAAKAEGMRAIANHRRYDPVEVSRLDPAVNGVYAIRRGTPLQVVFVIDVRAGQKYLVPVAH